MMSLQSARAGGCGEQWAANCVDHFATMDEQVLYLKAIDLSIAPWFWHKDVMAIRVALRFAAPLRQELRRARKVLGLTQPFVPKTGSPETKTPWVAQKICVSPGMLCAN